MRTREHAATGRSRPSRFGSSRVRRSHLRRRAGVLVAVVVAATGAMLGASGERAAAFKYPDTAEAKLVLDGTQTAPHDGFNLQIDTNGFGAGGGDVIATHMFCINSALPYRCGLPDELVRVQAAPGVAGLSTAAANRLAWILTNHDGYTGEEVQYAIWCVTDPGDQGAVGASDQLCSDSDAFAVPNTPVVDLATLGAAQVAEGTDVHFSLTTNSKRVELEVSDGGVGPALCGTAPDNAAATIDGAMLVQSEPVVTRTFELCLSRSGFAGDTTAVTLSAALEASVTNLQVWVHPSGPQDCQGVIDTQVTNQRISTSADAGWRAGRGSLTVRKTVVGDVPAGTEFTVHVAGDAIDLDHVFPDLDGDPYAHTFTDLPAGTYTVTETITGGATTVEITAGGVAIVARDDDTVIEVVNSFVGHLVLQKLTDIPVDDTFAFVVACSYDGEPVGTWGDPVLLAAGESFDTGPLPAGTTCSIHESDTGGAVSTVIAVDTNVGDTNVGERNAGETGSEQVGDLAEAIEIAAGDTVAVTFTNVFGEGSTTSSATTASSIPGSTTDPTIGTVGSTTTPGGAGPVPSSPSGGGLPVTGSGIGVALWLALAGVIGGGALAASTRRRRAFVRRA